MRLRLLAQFVAVVLIVLFVWLAGAGAERMVVLNRIYTRTGDAGDTALGDGTPGAEARAAGRPPTAPSTSSTPRSASRGCTPPARPTPALARVQNDLFDLGADLCTPDFENDAAAKRPRLRIVAAQVARLEARDRRDERRPRAAPQLRAARRHAARRAPAPLPHRLPPRRAAHGRARRPPSRSTPRRCATSTGSPTGCSSPPASPTTAARPDVLWVPGRQPLSRAA